MSSEFDAHIDEIDKRFRFVFAEQNRIVLTRLGGTTTRVLLDLTQYKDVAAAEVFGHVQLSPNRRWLLIPCLDGPWDRHESRKLVIFELASGRTETAVIPIGAFGFDMGVGNNSLCNWTSDESFVVSLTHYPPEGAHLYRKKFLIFDVSDVANPRELELGVGRPSLQSKDGYRFLFVGADERPHEWKIRVLSGREVRPASREEVAEFEELRLHRGTKAPATVIVEKVVKDEPFFGSNPDWDRYDIYINGRWTRRSDSLIERDPVWDGDLELYIWSEYRQRFQTFFTDTKSRYRRWYPGQYIGKISLHQLDGRAP